jgi:hypothetical protein
MCLWARYVCLSIPLSTAYFSLLNSRSIGPGGYGQNIAADGSAIASRSDNQADVVTNTIDNDWYENEVNNFTPYYGEATVPFNDDYLHFTQVVWKASVNVGCASSYCPAGTVLQGSNLPAWYTVCNYSPAGECRLFICRNWVN